MHHRSTTTAGRRTGLLCGLGAAALALSACSVADQAPSGPDASASDGSDRPAGGTVTIMTHDSFSLPDELVERFEAESGHTLRTTAPGDAGAVVNQLILAKDSPTVDGVFGVENHSAHALVAEGVVAETGGIELPDSAAEHVVDGRMVPIDQGQVCINMDPAWFTEHGVEPPTSIDQLTEPRYAQLLVVTDPVTSSPGLAFLAATVEHVGQDAWQDWWRELLEGGTRIASGWSDAYYVDFSGGEGAGDYPLVLSYSSSPAALPETTVLEDSCTPQIEYAGVVEGADNPAGAEAFIEFLLSEDVQAALPEAMYMYPIDDTVALPEEWAEHAPLVEDPITPDPATVQEHREDWLRQFAALAEGR